jgi:hypothetical protein
VGSRRGGQPEHKLIDRCEIRGALSGAIADEQLMLEQQRLRSDTPHAARAEEFGEGDEQVDGQEEQIAHESHVITFANLRKTARSRRRALELTNSPGSGAQTAALPGTRRAPRACARSLPTLKPVMTIDVAPEVREQILDEEHLRLMLLGHYIAGGMYVAFAR